MIQGGLLKRQAQRLFTHATSRNYVLLLCGISALTLVVRCLHIAAIYYSPMSDMNYYLDMAGFFRDGNFGFRKTLQPPGYPLFLSLVTAVGGLTSLKPILYTQAVIDAICVFPLAFTCRYLTSARAALFACLGFALYKMFIFNTGLVYAEAFAVDVMILTLAVFVSYLKRPVWWKLIWCGLLFGYGVHVRLNLAFLIFPMAAYIFWGHRLTATLANWNWRRRTIHSMLLGAVVGLTLLPYSIRNTIIEGRPTLLTTSAGLTLLHAHNPYANGGWSDVWNLPAKYSDAYMKLSGQAHEKAMLDHAVAFMRDFPAYEILHLVPERLKLTLGITDSTYWPWMLDSYGTGGDFGDHPFGPWLYLPLLGATPLLVIGSLGFFFRSRRLPGFLFWGSFSLLLLCSMFMGVPRYRSPVDVFLLISAGNVLALLHRTGTGRRAFVGAGVAWVAIAAVVSLVNNLQFRGPNLIAQPRFDAGREMVQGVYSLTTPDKTTKNNAVSVPVAELNINPGLASHLLLSCDYKVDTDSELEDSTFDIGVGYFDNEGVWINDRTAGYSLLPPRYVFLNKLQAKGDKAWRILHVPALTSTIRLSLTANAPMSIKIKNLRLAAPVWYD